MELLQTLLPGPRVHGVPRHVPGQCAVAWVERGGQRGHGVAAGEAPQLRLCHGIVFGLTTSHETLVFLLIFSYPNDAKCEILKSCFQFKSDFKW